MRAPLKTFLAVALLGFPESAATGGDDIEACIEGKAKTCVECDLSSRDLRNRDFKRSRLDRANLREIGRAHV